MFLRSAGAPRKCWPALPAVHNHRRVQGPLVQVMRVHLLDEAQEVAGTVGQASAEEEEVGVWGQTQSEAPPPPIKGGRRTTQAKWRSEDAQVSA